MESEFGHKDWPTVPGERTLAKIREVIEEKVSMPIYLIAWVSRDDDNYRTSDVDESFGFFPTREEAQAWVDGKHNFEETYPKYVARSEETNRKRKREVEVKQRIWDELKAEGVSPDFFRPVKAHLINILSYEDYCLDQTDYEVVEVERHG